MSGSAVNVQHCVNNYTSVGRGLHRCVIHIGNAGSMRCALRGTHVCAVEEGSCRVHVVRYIVQS